MVNVFLGTLAHHDQLSPAANTERSCIHVYHFPGREDGLFIDLSHTLSNGFLTEKHQVDDSTVHGWVESFTTCVAGKDRLYYVLQFDGKMKPTRYY
ncbi:MULTISPECIES: hypothetical protein [Niastella]|uniref:Uncharacterized protein n=1 Tax=Niastella soli TaxID=2821487 RepID=A0ABS3Z147_9BACT|nr:hypothetical protein [Niastella soli]MBO9203894.1 hypothetical protein [Niastella soli]